MGHFGKDITSTKVIMASFKWFLRSSSQHKDRHLQVDRECLQDRWEIIQSIGQHLPSLLLHLALFPAHVGDHPLASQQNNSCCLQYRGKQMSQDLRTCPNCCRFAMTVKMQMMRATICQTWAVQRVNPQSAWCKPNSPWSNLPNRWRRPTLVPSTSRRKYGWLGFLKKSISALSGGRPVWTRLEMDLCSGRHWLQIFWRHLRAGCHWIISIMPNEFVRSRWRCFGTNVQAKFGRWGKGKVR